VVVANEVKAGPIVAERGSRAHGFLPVATGADGGEIGIPVHIIAGHQPGPKVVVMSTAHGYEIGQISVIQELLRLIEPSALTGDLMLIPVANPIAFEMGTRGTWIDSLWGDSGNMNRLWPGRPNGWLTERFCYAISTAVFPDSTVVMDLHGSTNSLALSYGYVNGGGPGDLAYDISRVFGHELLVFSTPEELAEKRQTSGTSRAYLEGIGVAAYSCEIGEFYGLEADRKSTPDGELYRGVPEGGVTGVTNVMKHLKMIDGEPKLPPTQVSIRPELNLRPSHGGLLVTNYGVEALGTSVAKGTVLGTVVSPYTFEVLEEIEAPFDESLLIATTPQQPFTKVLPGEFGYIVADAKNTEVLPAL
jgi:uncharacterized protein